jgi:hypothetical protein
MIGFGSLLAEMHFGQECTGVAAISQCDVCATLTKVIRLKACGSMANIFERWRI